MLSLHCKLVPANLSGDSQRRGVRNRMSVLSYFYDNSGYLRIVWKLTEAFAAERSIFWFDIKAKIWLQFELFVKTAAFCIPHGNRLCFDWLPLRNCNDRNRER